MKNSVSKLKTRNLKLRVGSTLIEIIFATALVALGLMIVVLAIIESNRTNLRTNLTSTALNILQSQVEKDSRVAYNTLTANNPPIDPVIGLSEGSLTREVTETTTLLGRIKHVRYVLTWKTTDYQTIQTEYELTDKGVANE